MAKGNSSGGNGDGKDAVAQLHEAVLKDIVRIPRAYHEITGDRNAAALLNQSTLWHRVTTDPDGWFYKSDDEWCEELLLGRAAVRAAWAHLTGEAKGSDGKPKPGAKLLIREVRRSGRKDINYFRLDTKRLLRLCERSGVKVHCAKSDSEAGSLCETEQSHCAKSDSETTVHCSKSDSSQYIREERQTSEDRREEKEGREDATDDAERAKAEAEREEAEKLRADVQAVFGYHCRVMREALKDAGEHATAWRLTAGRRKKIETRLKEFTVEQLQRASLRMSMDPFSLGENDRNTAYCGPDTLFVNDERVDNWYRKPWPKKQGGRPDNRPESLQVDAETKYAGVAQ